MTSTTYAWAAVVTAPVLALLDVLLVVAVLYLDQRLETAHQRHDALEDAYDGQVADNTLLRARLNTYRLWTADHLEQAFQTDKDQY